MAYPKNDTDYREFIIDRVIDDGNGWFTIISTDGIDCTLVHKDWLNGLVLKPGLKYRTYAWMSITRGLYISGRVVRRYKTRERSLAEIRERTKQEFKQRDFTRLRSMLKRLS